MTVTAGLMASLAILMSSAWKGLGRPMLEAQSTFEIAQEAQRAAAYLGADFGGQLPTSISGDKKNGKKVGKLVVGKTELRLCFDGGTSPNGLADWASPDTVIVYALRSGALVREDQAAKSKATVARYLEQFVVTEIGSDARMELTFSCRGMRRTYTLIGKDK
jgi:hypothetical protein